MIGLKKHWNELVIDFKNYAIVLLALGTFFYIGIFVSSEHPSGQPGMLGASGMMLLAAMICFKVSLVYKKKLQEDTEQ